jgi:hypothetical protein
MDRRKVFQGGVETFSWIGGKIFVLRRKEIHGAKIEKRKDFQGQIGRKFSKSGKKSRAKIGHYLQSAGIGERGQTPKGGKIFRAKVETFSCEVEILASQKSVKWKPCRGKKD